MQVLDGKNHGRGGYDKFALDIIVEILNTGRHWGWLSSPMTAANYTQEAIQSADAVFLETLRALVDQWIDSGVEDGTETPSHRYVRGLPKGYSDSLFDILHRWLGRNMPKPALMTEGRIAILDQRPNPHGLDLETYARESAIYYLKELLECPDPHRLGKCNNPNCGAYFARKRKRKGDIKRGSYCGKCELIGAAERTKLSRQHRKSEQLNAAAEAWPQWTSSHRRPRRAEWVAKRVNRKFPRWPAIQAKWVTQNREEIQKRVESSASTSTPQEGAPPTVPLAILANLPHNKSLPRSHRTLPEQG